MNNVRKLCFGVLFFALSACTFYGKKVPEANAPELSAPPKSGTASLSSLAVPDVPAGMLAGSLKDPLGKRAVNLVIHADRQLNRFQNNAHTLLLCVYQLKEPNAFDQLSEEPEGMSRLLECSRFDGSVALARRIVVQPGQVVRDARAFAEGSRFVGIATGYFRKGKEKVTHIAPLWFTNGEFSGNTIEVELGPTEIEHITEK